MLTSNMMKFSLKNVKMSFFVLFVAAMVFFANPVFAARTITSATLDGASSVTVKGGTSITAAVTVQVTSPSSWGSTKYQIGSGSTVCVNHGNHDNPYTGTESFTIIAPSP